MAIDVSAVVSALEDAGVAVGAVGGVLLLVYVALRTYEWLEYPLYVRSMQRREPGLNRDSPHWFSTRGKW